MATKRLLPPNLGFTRLVITNSAVSVMYKQLKREQTLRETYTARLADLTELHSRSKGKDFEDDLIRVSRVS